MNNEYPNIPHINNTIFGKIGYKLREGAEYTAKNIGKAALFTGKKTAQAGWATAAGIGYGSMKAAEYLGRGTIATGGFLTGAIAKSLTFDDWRNPIGKGLTGMYKLSRSLVDYRPGGTVFNEGTHKLEYRAPKFRLTGKGKIAVIGAALAGIAMGTSNEDDIRQMGVTDTNVSTATPDYMSTSSTTSSSINNAGATGDLVFALHNNRHG